MEGPSVSVEGGNYYPKEQAVYTDDGEWVRGATAADKFAFAVLASEMGAAKTWWSPAPPPSKRPPVKRTEKMYLGGVEIRGKAMQVPRFFWDGDGFYVHIEDVPLHRVNEVVAAFPHLAGKQVDDYIAAHAKGKGV